MGIVIIAKPADMYDRDWEWSELSGFVADNRPGASLGIVSGRRRQGKTFLLEAVCEATGGFFYAASEELPTVEALRQLGEAVSAHLDAPGTITFTDWQEAVDALLSLATDQAIPVVLDEFPYLARQAKELPSILQRSLAPRRAERRGSHARLLLCGSSISFMGGLLTGNAPLRGRAGLELVVPTFDFRVAADFWQIHDHKLAALVFSVLGGTPAYRNEFLRGATPADLAGFDPWVIEHVLNPASPLFREVRSLLAEDPALRDTGLYHTVLAAVADGNHTRGGIAGRLERKSGDISHHLTVLEGAGLLVAEPDAFRRNRTRYLITEPLVRFYHAVIRPRFTQLERVRPGRAERIWQASAPTFAGQVAGPAFEQMCRLWCEDFAADETFGGETARALSGNVYDTANRTSHEVDIAVFDSQETLLGIGEAKWNDVMGMGHLRRLEQVAELLTKQGRAARVLVLFSGAGFMPQLRRAAADSHGRIQLVDLKRLYTGE